MVIQKKKKFRDKCSTVSFINLELFLRNMIDKKDFEGLKQELEDYDKARDHVISKSNEIVKLSKVIIYSVQREELNLNREISEMRKKIIELREIKGDLRQEGSYKVAIQEYVEAMTFYEIIKNGKLPTRAQLKVNAEDYLMGLCDLTGELLRKAMNYAIYKRYTDVFRIKELVSDIYYYFLRLNLRNSELRKKSDAIKYNLRKIEDVVFELKLREIPLDRKREQRDEETSIRIKKKTED